MIFEKTFHGTVQCSSVLQGVPKISRSFDFETRYTNGSTNKYRCLTMTHRAVGSVGGGTGALCVEIGCYADISWESRCVEINV